jgi:hypothetical protein
MTTIDAPNRDPRAMTMGALISSLLLARRDFAVKEILRRYDENVDDFKKTIDEFDLSTSRRRSVTTERPRQAPNETQRDLDDWLDEQDRREPDPLPMGHLMREIARSKWDMTGLRWGPDRVRAFVENESLYDLNESQLTRDQRRVWRTIKRYYGNYCRHGNYIR